MLTLLTLICFVGDTEEPIQQDVTLLSFSATYCMPCQKMKPVVDDLRKDGVSVQDVDITASPEEATRFSIKRLPTFVVMKNGSERARFTGITSASVLRDAVEACKGEESDSVPLYPELTGSSAGDGQRWRVVENAQPLDDDFSNRVLLLSLLRMRFANPSVQFKYDALKDELRVKSETSVFVDVCRLVDGLHRSIEHIEAAREANLKVSAREHSVEGLLSEGELETDGTTVVEVLVETYLESKHSSVHWDAKTTTLNVVATDSEHAGLADAFARIRQRKKSR